MRKEWRENGFLHDSVALAYVLICVGFLLLQMSCGDVHEESGRGVPVESTQGSHDSGAAESLSGIMDSTDSDLPKGIDSEMGSHEDEPSVITDADGLVEGSSGSVDELHSVSGGKVGFEPLPDARVVKIYLSFDDGPHSASLGAGRNYTENIIRALSSNSVQDGIKALFNVQTHVKIRGADSVGQELIKMMHDEGHIVGIHTGSTRDHVNHKVRAVYAPYDANNDGIVDVRDGENALESDMIRAIDRIEEITGAVPRYLRPTYGAHNSATRAAYSRHGLKMLMWDLDSGDSLHHYSAGAGLAASLRNGIRERVARGETEILVLFHDIKAGTQLYLDDYLIAMYEGAEAAGKFAVFPTTTQELDDFLVEY